MIKKLGSYDFLESASVAVHMNSPILIEIQGLKLTIVFEGEDFNAKPNAHASGTGQEATLTFTNFNLGTGHMNTVLLPLGSLNGRKLYMNYVVYGFGNPPVGKLFHYTIMLGENV